jgi:hypothetical protein
MEDMKQKTHPIRVLIVDDIAETRENLRKMLSFDLDIEVIGTAGNGLEGIELAKQHNPHIVLMDMNMPGMDGITATYLFSVCRGAPHIWWFFCPDPPYVGVRPLRLTLGTPIYGGQIEYYPHI